MSAQRSRLRTAAEEAVLQAIRNLKVKLYFFSKFLCMCQTSVKNLCLQFVVMKITQKFITLTPYIKMQRTYFGTPFLIKGFSIVPRTLYLFVKKLPNNEGTLFLLTFEWIAVNLLVPKVIFT